MASDKPRLGLWDTVSIIVGIIIGATIFKSPPDVFAGAGGPVAGLLVWAFIGLLAFVGALCYAELAATYRTAGGDYHYLTRAFGRPVGFFFAWAELSVIRTGGSIAIMAYVFSDYANAFLGATTKEPKIASWLLTSAAVLVLTAINALGVKPGKWTQNILTAAKVLGLFGVVAVGFFLGATQPAAPPVEYSPLPFQTLALAMVFVFYAYGGWNEAAYVAAETHSPRTTVLALLVGTGGVVLIYIIVNAAYLAGLGYVGVCKSSAVASDLLTVGLGPIGGQVLAILVMISALGAINGLLFTGVRLYQTFGREHRLFAFLGQERANGVGLNALIAQAFFSLLIIALIETVNLWKPSLGWLVNEGLGLGLKLKFVGESRPGFDTLVMCTAPVFWVFFVMSGVAYITLRDADRDLPREFMLPSKPFPFYPLLPLVFVGSSVWMFYKSLEWALMNEPAEAIVVGSLMFLGIPLYLVSRLTGSYTESTQPASR